VGPCKTAIGLNSNGQTAGVGERSRSVADTNDTHPSAGATSDRHNPDDEELDNPGGEEPNDATAGANMEAQYSP
jgi:hypothetical protein